MAGDKPPELIRTALVRGFFCEALAHLIGISAPSSDLFLTGLLSVTDADRPSSLQPPGIPRNPHDLVVVAQIASATFTTAY
jgi:hypothetical protein